MDNSTPAPYVTSILTILLIRFMLLIVFLYTLKDGKNLTAVFLLIIIAIIESAAIWSKAGLKKLETTIRIKPDRFFPDETGCIGLTIKNSKRLPVLITWSQKLPGILNAVHETSDSENAIGGKLYIPPYGEKTFSVNVKALKRGYEKMPRLRIQSRDMFGLFYRDLFPDFNLEVMVYPKLLSFEALETKPTDFKGLSRDERPYLFDPIMYMGLRDYTPDMPAKLIDWKATAHNDRILARIIESSSDFKILISIDTNCLLQQVQDDSGPGGQDQDSDFEKALSIAGSIAVWADQARIPFGFISDFSLAGKDGAAFAPVNRSSSQSRLVLEVLAKADFKAESLLEDMLKAKACHIPWGTTLVVIGGDRPIDAPPSVRQVYYYPLETGRNTICKCGQG